MENEIKAEKINLRKVFTDFWFLVPEYQRSYVWEEDNINDLLDDLWYAYENNDEKEYFLGSLVLKNTNNKEIHHEYEVLDGQQRLTTLFILQAVIRDLTDNKKLKKTFNKRIFQNKDEIDDIPERIRVVYRIRDDVEDFIKEFILCCNGTLALEKLKDRKKVKNISIANIANAILSMNEFFNESGRSVDIFNFSKFISSNVIFIYVATSNREDAFRLFTILNNRGIPLTNADILKSINIGELDENDRIKFSNIWEDIENSFGETFDRFLSFIRTIIVKEKARVNLLEEFEENVYKKNALSKGRVTIEFLKEFKDVYDKVINFEDLDFDDVNEFKNFVTIMKIGLPSEDWIPPLMLYHKMYNTNKLLEFLKKLEYKFTGDWILQETPTKRIENMNNILKKIEASINPDIIFNAELFNINSEELRKNLEGDIYGKRFARYILLKYEYTVSEHTVHLSDYKYITVEHVLPQNPNKDSEWCRIFNKDAKEKWTNKLANLVLISKKKNSRLSNLDFVRKKEEYLRGRIDVFSGSKIFVESSDRWDVDVLEKRQAEMLDNLINQ
ncbi:MAG: DUF262 domain-containing HNH endonuclease family protein [Methanosarcinales archaeon]|nr:DUF262 domain-containing HNH endonuclease family protein [Methanosarcinales archaeon]